MDEDGDDEAGHEEEQLGGERWNVRDVAGEPAHFVLSVEKELQTGELLVICQITRLVPYLLTITTNDPIKMTMVKTRMIAPMTSSVRPEPAKRKLQPSSQSVARMEQLGVTAETFPSKLSSRLSTLSIESSVCSSDSSSDEFSSPPNDSSCPPNGPSLSEMLSLASLASFAIAAGEGRLFVAEVEFPEKQLLCEGGFRMTMLSTKGSRIASRNERGFEEERWLEDV